MQNTKQVLDGDNKDIFKRKREFYLDEDLVDKIDSIEYGAQVNKIEEIEVNGVPVEPDESKTVKLKIPRVINAVTSDSESDALSAAMGKYLYTLYLQTGSLYRYRGSVATFDDLPESGNQQGDVYNILDTGMNYAWTGTEWDALGGSIYTAGANISINNNEISAVDTTYTAGEGITIGQGLDYSAMRGPCDEGFHVPSYDECNFILRVTSSQYTQTPGNLIKAPSNGYIRFTNPGNYDTGFTLRTRTDQGLNSNEAYLFSYDDSDSGHVQPLVIRPKSIGAGVRGFADIPVEADETWDVLYDRTRGTIYRNEELGLISVYSKETNNWVTLQDKNVGAENVGDNGYYFQWGNNYGFTNASEATSSEKVDASGYAPSTYNEPPINTRDDWSSVRNSDLWGGVTGVATIDNVISNTGVLSVNGQTGHVTVESGGKQSFFKTQAEYNALPASKESDGNLYIIVDNHLNLLTPPELYALGVAAGNSDDAIMAELSTHPAEYLEFAISNEWGGREDITGVPTGKTLYAGGVRIKGDPDGDGVYNVLITDMEENEFITFILNNIQGATQEDAEQLWSKRNTYTTKYSAFPK